MRIGSTKNLDYMTRYLKVSWETKLLDYASELLITTVHAVKLYSMGVAQMAKTI